MSRVDPTQVTVDLVHPPPYGEVPFKHIGLAYVAAGLRQAGFGTRFHDVSERYHRRGDDVYDDVILRYSKRAGEMSDLPFLDLLQETLFPEHGDGPLAARIRGQAEAVLDELADARVVLVTVNTLTAYFAAALGSRLRQRGVKVLFGGPLSRVQPLTQLLLRLGAADVVMGGEGDLTAPAAVRAVLGDGALADVPGAQFLEGDGVVQVPLGEAAELDALPWPLFEGNVVDQFIPIQASRACARRCRYCSETGIWGDIGFRRRSVPSVVAEMVGRHEELGLTDFHFHDDHLNSSKKWLRSFVATVRDKGFTWESFFEPYGLDRDLVERMADAGCRLVKYGVQSFSPRVLEIMGRAGRIEDILDVIETTYHLGISTHYDMLIGHPGETEDDHRTNLSFVDALYDRTGERLYFSPNPHYLAVGSDVSRHPEKYGVTIRHGDPRDFAPPFAAALAAGPPYPVGYASDVGRDTLMRRMDELAAILRKHGKDYLYLGQDGLPDTGKADRRQLPSLDGAADDPAAAAWARGDDAQRGAVAVLAEAGNLRLWSLPGRLRPVVPAGAAAEAVIGALAGLPDGAGVRLIGGEPTLAKGLPQILAMGERLARPVHLETNALRFHAEKYTAGMVRHGLRSATVVLLAPEPVLNDRLGGREGAFALALSGADRLLAAGVAVDLGLLVTPRTVGAVPQLAAFAKARFPTVTTLRVILAPLGGPDGLEPPPKARLNPSVAALVADAERYGQTVIVEDRT